MKVNIRTENAAFVGCKAAELARILRELAERLDRDGQPLRGEIWKLYDINGNAVGTARR